MKFTKMLKIWSYVHVYNSWTSAWEYEVKLEAFDTPDYVKHSEMYVYMLPFTLHAFCGVSSAPVNIVYHQINLVDLLSPLLNHTT